MVAEDISSRYYLISLPVSLWLHTGCSPLAEIMKAHEPKYFNECLRKMAKR